jgi:hypothetical protein
MIAAVVKVSRDDCEDCDDCDDCLFLHLCGRSKNLTYLTQKLTEKMAHSTLNTQHSTTQHDTTRHELYYLYLYTIYRYMVWYGIYGRLIMI